MVPSVVDARRDHLRETLRAVGEEWGGSRVLSGPELVIPVRREVTGIRKREVFDPTMGRVEVHPESGQPIFETFEAAWTEERAGLVVLPGRFDADLTTATQVRYRGIFEVPVHTAEVTLAFDFPEAGSRWCWTTVRRLPGTRPGSRCFCPATGRCGARRAWR